jgi:hypothetical protein
MSLFDANSQNWNGILNSGGTVAKGFIPTPKAA